MILGDAGGIGGVKFLDTDFIISGDERMLAVILLVGGVTTFEAPEFIPPTIPDDVAPTDLL